MTRTKKQSTEAAVREIRRKTRRKFAPEEKVRIVLQGLRGEQSISELCRREGIASNLYYPWSKDFLCLSTSLRRQSVIGEGLCVDRAAQNAWKEFFFLPAPVEAKHELVQVALKMFRANPVESSA